MRISTTLRWIYKTIRSLLLTLILLGVGLAVVLYVLLSIPPVQNKIREVAESELSLFFGGKVEIDHLDIFPLNEILLKDVRFTDPYGEKCLEIDKLGGGINLWRLVFTGEIEITYIELVGFHADIYQSEEGGPLNIDYIVKAFEPKDKNKPPAKFDLKIHNIVLRKGALSFSRKWKPAGTDPDVIDFNHIEIEDINADVALPRLSNSINEIDLRRLAFVEKSGLIIKDISGYFTIGPDRIGVNGLSINLPETNVNIDPFSVPLTFLKNPESDERLRLKFTDCRVTPSNLSALLPPLDSFNFAIPFSGVFTGNLHDIMVQGFSLKFPDESGRLNIDAEILNINQKGQLAVKADRLEFDLRPEIIERIAAVPEVTAPLRQTLERLKYAAGKLTGNYDFATGKTDVKAEVATGLGELALDVDGNLTETGFGGTAHIETPGLDIDRIAEGSPVGALRDLTLDVDGNIDFKDIAKSNGNVSFAVGRIGVLGRELGNITGKVDKAGNHYGVQLAVADEFIDVNLTSDIILDNSLYKVDLEANLNDFDTYHSLLAESKGKGVELKGRISLHGEGSSIDNASGTLEVGDFNLIMADGRSLELDRLLLTIDQQNGEKKSISLQSEIADLNLIGDFNITGIPGYFRESIAEICPAVIQPSGAMPDCGYGEFTLNVKDADKLIEFFSLPVVPLTELSLNGSFNSEEGIATIETEIPYIQQGKNNLVRGTYLDLMLNKPRRNLSLNFGTIYPTKKGDLKLDLNLEGGYGEYLLSLDFNRGLETQFYGKAQLKATVDRDIEGELEAKVEFLPCSLYLNGSEWKIEESTITYNKEKLDIDEFGVRHDGQYVVINGSNARDGSGMILLQLADINLDYIFETLNIPHVNFGGNATGEVTARGLLSNNLEAGTRTLYIRDLSYNNALIGDGDMYGILDLKEKMVKIGGLIDEGGREVAKVDGGVWFGRDSLAFDFDAKSVNIEFLKPFMQAFSSKVTGRASGQVKLFGTFSDIDMTGEIAAEDANILIDYINVVYTASDTVYMKPGRIEIPNVTIHDLRGGSASVEGVITHDYFHNPGFEFNIKDMDHLLVYDTNKKINNIWYGTIYAKGAGQITGQPGWVRIRADVETQKDSDFTFVLSDEQEAVKTNFLTFSDKRKEAYEASLPKEEEPEEPEFLKRFRKKVAVQQQGEPDVFTMDLRATITPDVKLNLIMDPVAGDKITAQGEGAMNMEYSSKTDELRLFGKYTLDRGSYNFSLQDIILKEFTIKPGSSIAFTGDPYRGILDITAAYRVNTSLTELDQSFATDRELNRTSVPVEALLKVTGPLLSPNIAFDIDLPTVTEETQRKVKSIISTDDMMSKEVLYLVALNKFYPPEYMTTTNSGGEWASVASSTISSQIQNLIGQLTDKFTLAPSFRSDKGDFSDVEVDVALSTNLFNNRLLINGNVGYRDPSNSSTMFVGDFDLEYLLTKSGNWRLKAYNHFNDQNYYLKSALTTQGIGIVWRKDFGFLQGNRQRKRDDNSDVNGDGKEGPEAKPIEIEGEEVEEMLEE